MNILLVDDHAIFKEGLRHILLHGYPFAKIDEASNAEDAIGKILKFKYDLIICDLTLPGRSGLDVVREVKLIYPKLPVLILSMHSEEEYAIRTLRAGAAGYVNKAHDTADVFKAIQMVMQGRKYVSPVIAEKIAGNFTSGGDVPPHHQLTDREFFIFKLIAEGNTVVAIAEQLSLASSTISTHRARILDKMGLRSNADLTKYALLYKLL